MHASVDGVYEEYASLLVTFTILETEEGPRGSMAKGFSKSLKSPKFTGMSYSLRVVLLSLTSLSRAFQAEAINLSRITPNIQKTKSKQQQILDEEKPLQLLKTIMKIKVTKM